MAHFREPNEPPLFSPFSSSSLSQYVTAKEQLLPTVVLRLVLYHAALSRAFVTKLRRSYRPAQDIFPHLPRSPSRAVESFPDVGVADATTHQCRLDDCAPSLCKAVTRILTYLPRPRPPRIETQATSIASQTPVAHHHPTLRSLFPSLC
jgi:hypothetical protein